MLHHATPHNINCYKYYSNHFDPPIVIHLPVSALPTNVLIPLRPFVAPICMQDAVYTIEYTSSLMSLSLPTLVFTSVPVAGIPVPSAVADPTPTSRVHEEH